jgi:hypothetical protein
MGILRLRMRILKANPRAPQDDSAMVELFEIDARNVAPGGGVWTSELLRVGCAVGLGVRTFSANLATRSDVLLERTTS